MAAVAVAAAVAVVAMVMAVVWSVNYEGCPEDCMNCIGGIPFCA